MALATEVWLKHPKTGYVVLVTHEETRDRCLSEGWTVTADPRLPAPAPVAEPISVPESAPAAAPAESMSAPPLAQPSVAGQLDDLTAVGDSPEELAQALEAADAAQVRERNTAARTAFGIETPPAPAQSVKPAKAGQTQQRGWRYAG